MKHCRFWQKAYLAGFTKNNSAFVFGQKMRRCLIAYFWQVAKVFLAVVAWYIRLEPAEALIKSI